MQYQCKNNHRFESSREPLQCPVCRVSDYQPVHPPDLGKPRAAAGEGALFYVLLMLVVVMFATAVSFPFLWQAVDRQKEMVADELAKVQAQTISVVKKYEQAMQRFQNASNSYHKVVTDMRNDHQLLAVVTRHSSESLSSLLAEAGKLAVKSPSQAATLFYESAVVEISRLVVSAREMDKKEESAYRSAKQAWQNGKDHTNQSLMEKYAKEEWTSWLARNPPPAGPANWEQGTKFFQIELTSLQQIEQTAHSRQQKEACETARREYEQKLQECKVSLLEKYLSQEWERLKQSVPANVEEGQWNQAAKAYRQAVVELGEIFLSAARMLQAAEWASADQEIIREYAGTEWEALNHKIKESERSPDIWITARALVDAAEEIKAIKATATGRQEKAKMDFESAKQAYEAEWLKVAKDVWLFERFVPSEWGQLQSEVRKWDKTPQWRLGTQFFQGAKNTLITLFDKAKQAQRISDPEYIKLTKWSDTTERTLRDGAPFTARQAKKHLIDLNVFYLLNKKAFDAYPELLARFEDLKKFVRINLRKGEVLPF